MLGATERLAGTAPAGGADSEQAAANAAANASDQSGSERIGSIPQPAGQRHERSGQAGANRAGTAGSTAVPPRTHGMHRDPWALQSPKGPAGQPEAVLTLHAASVKLR
jgi:hypothetical protein